MTQRLLMMQRHGDKARDGHNPNIPLSAHGVAQARQMGLTLKGMGYLPDLILHSPALRSQQTAAGMAEAMGYQGKIKQRDELFSRDATDTLGVVNWIGNKYRRPLLIGHRPALPQAIDLLSTGDPSAKVTRMPTAAIAFLVFTGLDWEGINPGDGRLHAILSPAILDALAQVPRTNLAPGA